MEQSLNGYRLCYLTTTGRVTGRPHEIEIWFATDRDDRIYLLSGGRDRADWVKNLRRNPDVQARIDGATYPGSAMIIEGEPDEQHARELLAAKYQDWSPGSPLSNWARTSLPVRIDLTSNTN